MSRTSRSGWNRSPCAAPAGRWALGTGAAKKCQGLHPGKPTQQCLALRVSSGRGQRWKNRLGRKEGAEHCMEAKCARQPRTLRAPTPPLRLQTCCGSVRSAERTNTPAASHVWNPALWQWDKRNPDGSGVLERCHEAGGIRM